MKTKIVYVLVSTERDIYLEQAYISMLSLRHHVPNAHIVLLVDDQTNSSFVGTRKDKIQLVDELVKVDLPGNLTAQQRSRMLKTSVRNLVDGDFLFVDCDTIITKSLEEIDSCAYDMAACQDSHSPFVKNPYRDLCLRHGKILDWPIEKELVYFNSGVIYVKDNQKTREFYQKWNEIWQDGAHKGVNMDQPSFAKTNYLMGHIVQILGDVWNCELKHGMKFLKDAKVVHYLCTNTDSSPLFIMNSKSELLKVKNGEINPVINRCFDDPFLGLTQVSQLVCGDDLYYLGSFLYNFFKCREKKWYVKLLVKLILNLQNIKQIL